ncbi:uncharacterized protein FTOL_07038 [Fusarium torulosum]|uniref:NmrA-like domain-containing protein n=1 Tax=Fusarium torulosum TaxID=33205 RepID=A0AAE8MB10_9HYPO|nr:uncharacterized protein FTOL_07038 [Fusarium torulosum]
MSPKHDKDQPQVFVNYIKSVAFFRTSGQLGRYLVESLLKVGKHSVTALTRKCGCATFPEGVNVAAVNYNDEALFVSALKGRDCLVIILTFTPDMGEIQMKIVRVVVMDLILENVECVTNITDLDWNITYESTSDRVATGRDQFSKGNHREMTKGYYARLQFPGGEATYERKLHNHVIGLPNENVDDTTKGALDLSQQGWSPDGQ